MANKGTLNRLSDEIIKEYLIFDPTSDSTKPPHIANGLFRACLGEEYNIKDIHEWVLSERRLNPQNKKKIISSVDIVKKYHAILQEGSKENPENIKQFRLFLEEIFNQDNTVYPSSEFSVMTISSHWLVRSRVNSEAHIGDFIYGILSKEIDGKKSPIIDLIQEVLKQESDDISKIIKPIIGFQSSEVKCQKYDVETLTEEEIKWDSYKAKLREGFDNLAINIRAKGEAKNSLLVLQRIICFAGFASLVYLTHANSAIYNKGIDVPIVIDASSNLESIKKASEQSYTLAKKSVEDYFVNTISTILKSEINNYHTIKACEKWIDEMVFEESEKESDIKKAVTDYFNNFVYEKDDPLTALSKALQIVLYTFRYKYNSPSDYCRVLGIRCGLVGPKGNRANIKRYLINSFTLETITLSILSKDDLNQGIDLKELGKKAALAYNIFFGANADEEYSILEQLNIAQATPGDLRGDLFLNAQCLVDTYTSLDLAKRYADGVTLIGWRL